MPSHTSDHCICSAYSPLEVLLQEVDLLWSPIGVLTRQFFGLNSTSLSASFDTAHHSSLQVDLRVCVWGGGPTQYLGKSPPPSPEVGLEGGTGSSVGPVYTFSMLTIVLIFSFPEMVEFQKIVGGFITLVDDVAKEVEKEKMKVWATR